MTTTPRKRGRPPGIKNPNAGRKPSPDAHLKKAKDLRKLQKLLGGYITEALDVAATIMGDTNALHKDKLAAAKVFIEKYATIEREIALTEQAMNKPIEVATDETNADGTSQTMGSVLSLGIIKSDNND